jgi:hypothetical protein
MPSKSAKQAKLMAAVANNPKFAKKVGIPTSVGQEFANADKRNKDMPSYFNSSKAKPGKVVKKYARGRDVRAHDKKELRDLHDEDFRIRNKTGSDTEAERGRIDRERSYLERQEGSYNVGGNVQTAHDRSDESLGSTKPRGWGKAQRGWAGEYDSTTRQR